MGSLVEIFDKLREKFQFKKKVTDGKDDNSPIVHLIEANPEKAGTSELSHKKENNNIRRFFKAIGFRPETKNNADLDTLLQAFKVANYVHIVGHGGDMRYLTKDEEKSEEKTLKDAVENAQEFVENKNILRRGTEDRDLKNQIYAGNVLTSEKIKTFYENQELSLLLEDGEESPVIVEYGELIEKAKEASKRVIEGIKEETQEETAEYNDLSLVFLNTCNSALFAEQISENIKDTFSIGIVGTVDDSIAEQFAAVFYLALAKEYRDCDGNYKANHIRGAFNVAAAWIESAKESTSSNHYENTYVLYYEGDLEDYTGDPMLCRLKSDASPGSSPNDLAA